MTAPFDAAVIVHNSDPEDLDRPDWPQPLIDLLYRRKELRGKKLTIEVDFEQPSTSIQYYQTYTLDVRWELPSELPLGMTYRYEVSAGRPGLTGTDAEMLRALTAGAAERSYRLTRRYSEFTWLREPNDPDLEEQLLRAGVLCEGSVGDESDAYMFSSECRFLEAEPKSTLVSVENGVSNVAFGDLRNFPEEHRKEVLGGIVQPVLVRDQEQLAVFRQQAFEGFEEVKLKRWDWADPDDSFGPSRWTTREEHDTLLAQLQTEEHFWMRYSSDPIRSEYSGRLDIWISRSQVLIDSHPGSGGSARVRGTIQQDPYPEVWNTLIELAKDRRIWKNTGAARWVFWFVEHQNSDQTRLGCHVRAPAGAFPDFCLHLMRLVGLEGELQRFPPRRAPWL